MIIRRTYDIDEINEVLKDPEIESRIKDDNTPDIEPPINSEYCYLVGEVDKKIIGLIILHPFRDGLEAHYQVLKKYRKDYAIKFAEEGLKQLSGKILYGLVPTCFPDVLAFDKKIGFEHIETLDDTFIKDGEAYNYNVMRLQNGLS